MQKERFIVALRVSDQSICISKSKVVIAKFIGIVSLTVYRHQLKGNYTSAKYRLWFDQSIERINRGGNGFK